MIYNLYMYLKNRDKLISQFIIILANEKRLKNLFVLGIPYNEINQNQNTNAILFPGTN